MSVEMITMPGKPFRPNTQIEKTKYAFIYNCGGIGDYIHWTTPIQWAIENTPHLHGVIGAPTFFGDLARLWFAPYADRFEVIVFKDINEERLMIPRSVPDLKQLSNQCSHHLTQVGWTYYCQMGSIPAGWNRLPPIVGNEADISRFNLPRDYAVIPTHATADNRRMPAQTIEEISRHLIRRGVMPVYIGKSVSLTDYRATTTEADLSNGIDLRDKTNLVEAACIMARSRLVLGLDGGMLHLAACSSVPVIMAFTSVDPRYRVPPRPKGARTAVVIPPESLECRFCNSHMKFVLGHDFKNCLYKDNFCATNMTADGFIPAINTILQEE